MTAVARGFSMNVFIKKLPDIAYSLRSHQINVKDKRIDGDKDIVLIRFFGGHLG